MSDFSAFEFAEHLIGLEVNFHTHVHHALEQSLRLLQKDMKGQIGHYQDEAGPYPAWQPLAESTEAIKATLGAPANAPLERHGDLKASFKYETDGVEGIVGSTDPVMVDLEYGTRNMPPRPVVGPALYKNREHIRGLCAQALIETLAANKLTKELIRFE